MFLAFTTKQHKFNFKKKQTSQVPQHSRPNLQLQSLKFNRLYTKMAEAVHNMLI